jgi:hypothetical protein
MVNNKYATHWTYYNRSNSMNVNLGFSAVSKKYSTCILFIPSEVIMELVNTIADHEFCSQFTTTTTKLLHLVHTIPLSRSRIQVASEQIIKNGVTICIYSYIKNIKTYLIP